MMKRLLTFALCFGMAWPAAHAVLDRATFIGLSASVVRVEAPRRSGGYSIGSGVAVGGDRVVTNCHVTRDAREIHVVRGDLRWPVAAQSSDIVRDLCMLQVPGLQAPAALLGRSADLSVGQPVTAMGYTGGIGMQNSTGEVVDLHRHDGGRVIQSTNWFSSGASGGGLFDDDGRLVGILTFRLRGGEAHYFAAPAEWLLPMLDDANRASYRAVMPLDTVQVPYWQTSAAAQPRFLQAAVLVRDHAWGELQSLADAWSRAEPGDAEPWYLLGLSLEQLDQPAAARRAFECTLSLEPTHIQARIRLAALPAADTAGSTAAAIKPLPCLDDLR